MKKFYLLLLLTAIFINAAISQTSIFAYGSSWKYLDNGTDQDTAWALASFDDAAWLSGNGQLGYGDGDETTLLSYGADVNNKYITSYFRKTINIVNPVHMLQQRCCIHQLLIRPCACSGRPSIIFHYRCSGYGQGTNPHCMCLCCCVSSFRWFRGRTSRV